MTSDIVQRLRDGNTLDIGEAADRIEVLEAEVERLREALVEQVKQYPDYSAIARKALEGRGE